MRYILNSMGLIDPGAESDGDHNHLLSEQALGSGRDPSSRPHGSMLMTCLGCGFIVAIMCLLATLALYQQSQHPVQSEDEIRGNQIEWLAQLRANKSQAPVGTCTYIELEGELNYCDESCPLVENLEHAIHGCDRSRSCVGIAKTRMFGKEYYQLRNTSAIFTSTSDNDQGSEISSMKPAPMFKLSCAEQDRMEYNCLTDERPQLNFVQEPHSLLQTAKLHFSSHFAEPLLFTDIHVVSPDSSQIIARTFSRSKRVLTTPHAQCFRHIFEISFRFAPIALEHRMIARVEYRSLHDSLYNNRREIFELLSESPFVGIQIPLSPFSLGAPQGKEHLTQPELTPCSSVAELADGFWIRREKVLDFALSGPDTFGCDNNMNVQIGPWQQSWRWQPFRCTMHVFISGEVRECLDTWDSSGKVSLLGDSVTHSLVGRMHCAMTRASIPLEKLEFINMHMSFQDSLSMYREMFKGRAAQGSGGVLLMNPSGLWELLQGTRESWVAGLREVLDLVSDAGFDHVLFRGTTTIHQIHYMNTGDRFDEQHVSKWGLTQPRVEELNAITLEMLKEYPAITYLDMEPITKLRHDDPFDPTDMRHYGPSTDDQIGQLLLNIACGLWS